MTRLLTRLGLAALLSYIALSLQKQNYANAQTQTCSTCPDDCLAEDYGESCTNDVGNNCTWQGSTDYCRYTSGCPSGDSIYSGFCCYQAHSPIVIDTRGRGFTLTNAPAGVWFAITSAPTKYQTAWTAPSVSNAWLVLDRNGNGLVDDGTELFGNYTDQPTPPPGVERNGFTALAVFDDPENGGNGDGVIDDRDAVYSHLRLWEDANHNGISEPGELVSLPSRGVEGIDLHYSLSKRVDQYGNTFRFRSAIFRERGYPDGRFAWDVFLDYVGQSSK